MSLEVGIICKECCHKTIFRGLRH